MRDRPGASGLPCGQTRFDSAWWARLRRTAAGSEDGIDRQDAHDAGTGELWHLVSTAREAAGAALLDHAARVAARLGDDTAEIPVRCIQGGRLVLAYPAGDRHTLAELAGPALPVARFLDLAIAAAGAVARMHGRGVLHRALRASRLIAGPDGSVRLTGLGSAVAADLPAPPVASVPATGGLAYAAPEQARRQDPASDARSDLYALGVVLYELLTGRLPLSADTTARWLHAHVAVAAAAPGTLRADVPAMIDAVLLKLIAKEPAERYQSADALAADLALCRADWAATGEITPFAPGRADLLPGSGAPGALVGRADTFARLTDAFVRVRQSGAPEAVIVTGAAGAGKSALVAQLSGLLIESRTHFATGRCDPLRPDSPFAPFAQILRTVITRLLSESSATLENARARLCASLPDHGRLLVELVPEAEFLLPPPGPLPDRTAGPARTRLVRVILQALAAFAGPGAPFVVVLDDLQWADAATLSVVRAFLEAPPEHLLVILVCREEDLARRPDVEALAGLARSGRLPLTELVAGPLAGADTAALVAATLGTTLDDVAPLAAVIHTRTGGNAFHVGQMLRALVEGKILAFSPQLGRWTWDGARIACPPAADGATPPRSGAASDGPDLPHRLTAGRTIRGSGSLPETFGPAGDPGWSRQTGSHIASGLLLLGANLAGAREEIARGLAQTRAAGHRDIGRILEAQLRLVDGLVSGDPGPADSLCDAAIVSIPGRYWVRHYEGIAAFLSGDTERARTLLEQASMLAWSAPAHMETACTGMFLALATARSGTARADPQETAALLGRQQHHLAAWADFSPATFRNKCLLVEAEQARLAGDIFLALSRFEQAAAAAAEAGFVHEQALAHELAALTCHAHGLATAADGHLRAARTCYRQWGAAAKARQLQDRLPPRAEAADSPAPGHEDQAGLDLAVVTRAAQALSEEIVLDRLIDRLMTDMLVHAGAQYGLLLLMEGERAMIEATARLAGHRVEVEIARAPPGAQALPLAVLTTVLRTKRPVVFADAFAQMPRLRASGPTDRSVRSLICLPLIKRGALVGILYLENSLAAGVFTPDRTAMLEVLAPQAAISLDAARLYKTLVDENARRARTELALRQARAELARTSHLTVMGGLAASIAHEINQPLAGIVAGADAAMRWLDRATPDIGEATDGLRTIRAAGLRAAGIVKSLRALARQSPAVFSPLRIEEVVEEVLRLASTEIEMQQVSVVRRLDPAGNRVMADPIQLQQVVLNLVVNGIEAMADTPPPRRRLVVETRRTGVRVEVGIADCGSGIAPGLAGRIFDPLFTTKDTGMGMGLAICRSIIAAHGGTLDAAAQPGGGSRFFFSLALDGAE